MIFKFRSIVITGLISGLLGFFSLELLLDIPSINDRVKQSISARLSDLFDHKIEITHISGGVFSGIVVDDLVIYEDQADSIMAKVHQVLLDVSPRILFGDFVHGIKRVTFDGVHLNVIRDKEKKINVFEFVKLNRNGRPSSSVFAANMYFKNISGVYIDELGWHKNAQRFEQPFESGTGQIIFQDNNTINLNVLLNFLGVQSQLQIDGEVKDGGFFYEFSIDHLLLDHWSDYVLPFHQFSIQDDAVSISGSLYRSSDSDLSGLKLPFKYSVEIAFDYLTYQQRNVPYLMENLNGRVVLSNEDSRIIKLDAIRGEFESLPIEIDGHIYLDEMRYDVHLTSIDKVSFNDSMSKLGIRSKLPIYTDLDIDIHIADSFNRPSIKTNVYSESIQIENQELGKVDLQFLTKNGITTIQHVEGSDVLINGQLNKKDFLFDVQLNDVKLPFIEESVPVKLSFSGLYSRPMIHLDLVDFNHNIFGYGIKQLVASMNIDQHVLTISEMVVLLDNRQQLSYFGQYHFDSQSLFLEQTGLTLLDADVPTKSINKMSSTLDMVYRDQQWVLNFDTKIEGDLVKIYDVMIDHYKLSIKKMGPLMDIQIDSLALEEQRISGAISFDRGAVISSALKLHQVDVNKMGILFPHIYYFDLSGYASGAIKYRRQNGDDNYYHGQLSIKNFETLFGQLGDIDLNFTYEKDVLDILSLRLSKIHNAHLSGTYINQNEFNFQFFDSSYIRLDAFKYFAERKLFGGVELVGDFSKSADGFSYDGFVESDQLEYDTNNFDYVFVDFEISKDEILIRNSRILFDDGEINLKGEMDNIFGQEVATIDYDIDVIFNHFKLNSFRRVYHSYNQIQLEKFDGEKSIDFSEKGSFLYHKYLSDNIDFFDALKLDSSADAFDQLPDINGYLDGRVMLSRSIDKPNHLKLSLSQFKYNEDFGFDQLMISTAFINLYHTQYSVVFNKVAYYDDVLNELKLDIDYFSKQKRLSSTRQYIRYKGETIVDPIMGSYQFDEQKIDILFDFKQNDISVVSMIFPVISRIDNQGRIKGRFKGSFDELFFTSDMIHLKDFKLTFDEQFSMFDSSIKVSDFSTKVLENQLLLDGLVLNWKGADTFRKVTRAKRNNQFKLKGYIGLHPIDLVDKKLVEFDYNLRLDTSLISVNFPDMYVGDISVVKPIRFVGYQGYPLFKDGKESVRKTLGTTEEKGPLLSSELVFVDGVFSIGRLGSKKKKMRALLDLGVTIGPGMYVQGSLFGDGIYNLANNIYLEVDKIMEKSPFRVGGTFNSMDINTTIDFYEGSITIFDGVYQLLRSESQTHYFQEIPDFMAPQQIRLHPKTVDGVTSLSFDMSLRALRIKDYVVSTENIRDQEYPYQAIGLVIDGPLSDISSGFKVLDYGLSSYTASYPSFLFYGQYDVDLNSQQNFTSQSYYGLKLVMPSIVSDSEDTSFVQFGRQQLNNLFKSSLRPYERRVAQRFGLYDFRIDYDVGRTVLYSDSSFYTSNEDLLGINVISDLYDERLFLDFRTDVNLSSEEAKDQERGFKLTQVELRYYVSQNFTVGLKNINEYSEVTDFDPRLSLNYGYSF